MGERIPTVNIPAKFYDAALQWCNERRAEDGKEPLVELPEGKLGNGSSCPCGEACGWHVGYHNSWPPGAIINPTFAQSLPDDVQRFVGTFDSNAVSGLCRPIRIEEPADA